jgi:hypothetical protein
MEPRNDESRKAPEPRKEEKKRRFQIVKLEERIAPGGGKGKGSNIATCGNNYSCLAHCSLRGCGY